jgi:hypothetical protein
LPPVIAFALASRQCVNAELHEGFVRDPVRRERQTFYALGDKRIQPRASGFSL